MYVMGGHKLDIDANIGYHAHNKVSYGTLLLNRSVPIELRELHPRRVGGAILSCVLSIYILGRLPFLRIRSGR
jgi:hypothetical protein